MQSPEVKASKNFFIKFLKPDADAQLDYWYSILYDSTNSSHESVISQVPLTRFVHKQLKLKAHLQSNRFEINVQTGEVI